MRQRRQTARFPRDARSAAVFVDYENLFDAIREVADKKQYEEDAIGAVMAALVDALERERQLDVSICKAYADFGALEGGGVDIQQSIIQQGGEPRFTPSAMQPNAAEVQLLIDATHTAASRPDLQGFVILTGDRHYPALEAHLRSLGRVVVVASIEPPAGGSRRVASSEWLDVAQLLRQAPVGEEGGQMSYQGEGGQRAAREGMEYHEVKDEAEMEALRIIEEYFGQYEEVYLTPLLRKLSELLAESEDEPKTIIANLTKVGAVWLEKRRGFPYDYTVLLMDGNHPDVARIRELYGESDDESGRDGAPGEPAEPAAAIPTDRPTVDDDADVEALNHSDEVTVDQ